MNTPYVNATDFLYDKIKEVLEKYHEVKQACIIAF